MSRCCICGSKFSEGMRPLLLTRGNPQELVCGSCVKILKGLQDRAAEGSADYPAALDAISDVAEGNATPFARSYLREYITRTNETWESKTERSGRNGANARPTFAEGPGNRPREPRRTAEKFCPACGGKNPAGNRFCLACGKPLSTPAPQNSGDALKRGDPIKNVLDGMIESKAEPGHGSAEEKRGMLTDLEKVIHPAEEEYGPQAEPKHTERKQSGSVQKKSGRQKGLEFSENGCCLCGKPLSTARRPLSKKYPQYLICPECEESLENLRQSAWEGSSNYPDDRENVVSLGQSNRAMDRNVKSALMDLVGSLDKKYESNHRERKKKLVILLIVALLALALVGALGVFLVMPSLRYKQAVKLYEDGQYKEAAAVFSQMGEYKDSDEMVRECWYCLALKYYKAEDYDQAARYFKKAGQYRDSEARLKKCEDPDASIIQPEPLESAAERPEAAVPEEQYSSPTAAPETPAPEAPKPEVPTPEVKATAVPEDASAIVIPTDAAKISKKKAICAAENACNLRRSPSQDGQLTGTLKRGETVVVEAVYKGFLLVRIGSDRQGWVSGKYLIATWMFTDTVNTEIKGIHAPSAEITNADVWPIVAKKANFRVGPDVSYAKINSGIERGKKVVVLCQEGDWVFCNYKGDFGWIALSNFTDKDF